MIKLSCQTKIQLAECFPSKMEPKRFQAFLKHHAMLTTKLKLCGAMSKLCCLPQAHLADCTQLVHNTVMQYLFGKAANDLQKVFRSLA